MQKKQKERACILFRFLFARPEPLPDVHKRSENNIYFTSFIQRFCPIDRSQHIGIRFIHHRWLNVYIQSNILFLIHVIVTKLLVPHHIQTINHRSS